jgi:AcrR family transcriptional regulator
MPSATRQKLVDIARQRFYRDGFRNVGIDAILTDVGISKTAFYKHFESKEDLMIAVLEEVDTFLRQKFRAMVRERGGRSAAAQLHAILDVVQQVIENKSFHGCIFVNAVMEFPLPHDPAHEAAVRHKHAIEEFDYELAERAHAADPQSLSRELCMIIEGAYVTRSLTGDASTTEIARRIAEHTIERHLPSPGRIVNTAP